MNEENCPCRLTSAEWEVLEMYAGLREWEHGAWVNACAEFLEEAGLVFIISLTPTERGYMLLTNRDKYGRL